MDIPRVGPQLLPPAPVVVMEKVLAVDLNPSPNASACVDRHTARHVAVAAAPRREAIFALLFSVGLACGRLFVFVVLSTQNKRAYYV